MSDQPYTEWRTADEIREFVFKMRLRRLLKAEIEVDELCPEQFVVRPIRNVQMANIARGVTRDPRDGPRCDSEICALLIVSEPPCRYEKGGRSGFNGG